MSDEMNLELGDVLKLDPKELERADKARREADLACRAVNQAYRDADDKRRKFADYLRSLESYKDAKKEFEFRQLKLINHLQELHEAGLIPNEHQ